MGLPGSKGVPEDFVRHTLVAPYGDIRHIEDLFKDHGAEIAAIIVEPVGGNDGVIIPDLPPEEAKELIGISVKSGFAVIFLAAPTSTKNRLKNN